MSDFELDIEIVISLMESRPVLREKWTIFVKTEM